MHRSRLMILALLFVLCTSVAYSQGDDDSLYIDMDTTWGTLDPEEFDFEEQLFDHYSHGWFPQPFPATSLSFVSNFLYSDVFDRGNGIRSSSFAPTTEPFTWHNPYEGGERDILQPYKPDEEDDGYPYTGYEEYALSYLINLPLPSIVRLGAGLQITEGLIFSEDTSRNFLSLSGVSRPFREISVIDLKEYKIVGSAGLNIPFYGVFLDADLGHISSYYYLYAGASAQYALVSKGTQYSQIADVKDQLRYGNGTDTATMKYKVRFDNLNRFRTTIDGALGFHFTTEFFVFSFEMFASVPIKPVLNDATWEQYTAGFRIGLGYQWLPEKRRRRP